MGSGSLGRNYQDGELIVRQGEVGNEMFVILEGEVEVLVERDGRIACVATLGAEEIIGEMAVFEQEVRSASVRARGSVRALTIDRKNLMTRVSEDPTLAFRLIRTLCRRIRALNEDLAKQRGTPRS